MNISLALKQLTTKQYQLTARERLMVIIATGFLVLFTTLYISTSEAIIEPVLPNNNVVTTTQPALSMNNQALQVTSADQPIRDPFAKPPEMKDQNLPITASAPKSSNKAPNSMSTSAPSRVQKNTATSSPPRDFKLTGIVSSGNQGLAVIMTGGKSKSYGIRDTIGAYRIVAINADNVVLANNNNKIVLRLESVSQKEGKTSDK